ncbi:protein FAR1-RELATED SEQUENCE 5-like [Ipomoea triloba]|uniref:protein FAR1-RELATED SEQUENCE 5-like n=1 Tax=Ipomoea triloba TaxID=35885 RepID=UPI00125E0C40|nr:protein FAR1-RELATED SEQUENCE 5-like [Ipomoea triloba]
MLILVLVFFSLVSRVAASGCDVEGLSSGSFGSNEFVMHVSPRRTKYWMPICDKASKPFVGQRFSKLAYGVDFYIRYVSTVGFDVRRNTKSKDREGKILRKYLVCSRQGFKQTAKEVCSVEDGIDGSSISPKRRRGSNRVGCNAKIIFKLMGDGGYSMFSLELRHTHCLCSEVAKPFMKVNHKLNLGHQSFVANCARANIGPIKLFKLYKQMVGEYADVGPTSVDFQNFKRDLMAYISGGDAQLIVEKFLHKKELLSEFSFDYMMWMSMISYRVCFGLIGMFGRILRALVMLCPSMRLIKLTGFGAVLLLAYNLVFVPFTCMDNHKKSVMFAAGLIAKEDIDSYVWLLDNFKRAMGHEPTYVVTD